MKIIRVMAAVGCVGMLFAIAACSHGQFTEESPAQVDQTSGGDTATKSFLYPEPCDLLPPEPASDAIACADIAQMAYKPDILESLMGKKSSVRVKKMEFPLQDYSVLEKVVKETPERLGMFSLRGQFDRAWIFQKGTFQTNVEKWGIAYVGSGKVLSKEEKLVVAQRGPAEYEGSEGNTLIIYKLKADSALKLPALVVARDDGVTVADAGNGVYTFTHARGELSIVYSAIQSSNYIVASTDPALLEPYKAQIKSQDKPAFQTAVQNLMKGDYTLGIVFAGNPGVMLNVGGGVLSSLLGGDGSLMKNEIDVKAISILELLNIDAGVSLSFFKKADAAAAADETKTKGMVIAADAQAEFEKKMLEDMMLVEFGAFLQEKLIIGVEVSASIPALEMVASLME